MIIDTPEYTIVICPKLDAHGDDPRTFARDDYCNACGNKGHEKE